MWSISIEILNPYEAIKALKPVIDVTPKKTWIQKLKCWLTGHAE